LQASLKIFKNFGYLSVGKTLGDLFTFLLFVILSRTFGQVGLGQYSFAMALAGFFLVFADFGLYHYSVKEMSRKDEGIAAYYGRIFALRIVMALSVLAVVLIVLPWLPFSQEQKAVIAIIGAYQVFYTLVDGFTAIFVAREEMFIAGLLELTIRLFSALAAIVVMLAGGSLVASLSVLPVITLLQLGWVYILVVRKYGSPRPDFSWRHLVATVKDSSTFAVFRLLSQLSTRLDVVLLGLILGAAAAGVYNAAYRIIFLLMYLAFYASMALFPTASRLYQSSKEDMAAFYHKTLGMIIIFSLPLAAGIWLIAPGLIDLIYGAEFLESVVILRYLAWVVFFAFLQNILGMFLIATDRQVERTKSQWAAVWVNGLGQIILIPLLGVQGAAIATLISEGLLVIVFVVRLRQVFGWPKVGSKAGMSAIGAAIFCLLFVVFSSLSIIVVIPASAILYLAILFLFKDFRENEGRKVIEFLMGKIKRTVEI
jgi:O-antigen/teichoic acid export membrane protein